MLIVGVSREVAIVDRYPKGRDAKRLGEPKANRARAEGIAEDMDDIRMVFVSELRLARRSDVFFVGVDVSMSVS